MHIIIGIIALIGGAYFWAQRARNAAKMTSELADVATDIYLAAKRFGFRRKVNRHPVESIEDRNLAVAGIACAFLELGSLPTQDQRDQLHVQLQSVLNVSQSDAEEMMILGRWLVNECASPDAAITRMAKRLFKISGMETFSDLLHILQNTLPKSWNSQQISALDDVKLAFKIR